MVKPLAHQSKLVIIFYSINSPVGWSSSIHWLHHCRVVRPLPNECPEYDTKQSDGEAQALEIRGMWSILLLLLLPVSLWTREVLPDMGQIEQTVCKQITDVKLWQLYSNNWNLLTMSKKSSRMLSTKFVYKSYIYSIYMYKQNVALYNLHWLICHKTKPN